jgi:uncharacterized protein (DUF302 family)
MLFEIESPKTIDDVDASLREAAKNHHFGVLGVHDLERTLKEKGLPIDMSCRVYEICNPQQAKQVLQQNGSFSSLLPCRVSVYGSPGKLKFSMVLPTSLFPLVGDNELAPVASELEEEMKAMIREAAA